MLSGDRGGNVVLALDFEAVGRPEACFSELAPMLDPPRETWRAVQPRFGDGAKPSAIDYLSYWSGGLQESGREIHAVLGYCAGGPFAAALAERIARWQPVPPAAVLLDPEWPTAATLIQQFDNAVRGLAEMASSAELATAREAAARLRHTGDLAVVGAQLTALYREASQPAFARIGLKPAFQDDLLGSYQLLMSYLIAAADMSTAQTARSAIAILSASHPCEPGDVARQVRTEVDHASLLRSRAVAEKLSDLLEQRASGPTAGLSEVS